MQGAFIQPMSYSPPIILGRRLRPFSCWHGLVLDASASTYLLGGQRAVSDLLFGIWVCSHDFADGFDAASDLRAVNRWGRSQRKRWWRPAADLGAAAVLFDEHIRLSLTAPDRWQDGAGTPLRAPLWWHLALFARETLHCSESEAWDFPLSRLICYRDCKAESEGGKDLMTDDEAKGIRLLEKDAVSK